MELRHLRYFLAVAEDLNFHRAAERLHVAQPALSRQVRALEEHLGAELVERLPRGIRLTEAGKAFLADVRGILADVARAEGRVRRVAQGELGQITIGFNEIAARRPYLPGFFQAARAVHPDIALQLRLLPSQPQLDAVRAGQLDAGFLFHRPAEDPGLSAILIDLDNYAVAMPSGHALARRPDLRLADLRDEPFILMSQGGNRDLYGRLMAACVAGGLVPHQVYQADNEYAIVNLVAAGVGLAFLNRSFNPAPFADVILRVLDELSVPVRLELVWRRDNHSPALARFVDTVSASPQAVTVAAAAQRPD